VARLILFLYTRQYPGLRRRGWQHPGDKQYQEYQRQLSVLLGCNAGLKDPSTSLCVEAAVHGLAEKYIVPELKNLSATAYCSLLRTGKCGYGSVDHIESVSIIYQTTKETDILRRFSMGIAHLTRDAGNSMKPYEDLIRSCPDFAWEFVSTKPIPIKAWCTRCKSALDRRPQLCRLTMMALCHLTPACGKLNLETCPVCLVQG
jgi:hypothetical protein